MHLRTVGIAVIGFACVSPETQQQTTDSSAPAVVTLDQFRQLDWIVGLWKGSGGAYPAFFEEYRIVDDSTIQMRALSDSTFSVATDSSWIEFRNGQIGKRRADREYVVIAASADSVRFAAPGSGGHTFTRTAADEWVATLHPIDPGGQTTVYTMRRFTRTRPPGT